MFALHLPTLITAHAWVLLVLTILVGMLWRALKKPSLRYWFYSDICAHIGAASFLMILADTGRIGLILFAVSLWLTMYFRVLALCSKEFAKPFKKIALSALAILLMMNLLLAPQAVVFRTFVNSLYFVALGGAMFYVLIWDSGLRNGLGRFLIFVSTAIYSAVAAFRAINVVTLDPVLMFSESTFTRIASTSIMLAGVLAHIGFIVIVLEELNRAESSAAQALVREGERRLHAEERERESRQTAEEQKRLIEVLTHEVRQPLNNASAALQSIGNELMGSEMRAQNQSVVRAQAVIDRVGMALSNALVAATILERRRQFNPVRYEPALLVEMVALDFAGFERARISIDSRNAPLYVTADPVLLRIALRNLLDNALRYSPPDSSVSLQVSEEEIDIGVCFRVENIETDPGLISEVDIFDRRVRGHADMTGSGMGLYITSEIAKLHQGWVRTHHENGRRIFVLFLQD